MSGVYVLELNNDNKYYVGKSENINNRIKTHKQCGEKCAQFVSASGGVKNALEPLTPRDNNLSNWEKDETITRMIKHGFNNVRGWEFTNVSRLTNQECDMIKMSIFGLGDRCRNCGNSGHFAKNCSSKKAIWLKNLEDCYNAENKPKTSIDVLNDILDDVQEEQITKPQTSEAKVIIKEMAKTGRSKCQICKELIPKGKIRIGIESKFKEQTTIKWHHESCYYETNGKTNLKNKKGTIKEDNTGIKNNKISNPSMDYKADDRLSGKVKPPKGWTSVMSKCVKCYKNGILPFIENCANCGRIKHPAQKYHGWFYA